MLAALDTIQIQTPVQVAVSNQCKALKNQNRKQNQNVQCPHKCKLNQEFCGKHIRNGPANMYMYTGNTTVSNTLKPIQMTNANTAKITAFRELEKNQKYNEFLITRKNYIKEPDKIITLVDFLENDKIESYPVGRIAATLEHYNLIPRKNTTYIAKFTSTQQNSCKLKKHMDLLLKATEHINKIIKLQRFVRVGIKQYYNRLRGPALFNRGICVNEIDFYSLDPIIEIEPHAFFSFKDDSHDSRTGHIYGFHIDSIVELIVKSDENYWDNFKKNIGIMCYRQLIRNIFNHYNKIKIANPYTRTLLSSSVKLKVITLMAKAIYSKPQNANCYGGDSGNWAGNGASNGAGNGAGNGILIDYKTHIRNKAFAIFQKIDNHGYFTDFNWLFEERPQLIKIFYRKLTLLWNFEFGLSETAKYKIAKTGVALFANCNEIMNFRGDKYHLLDKVLDVVNKMVSNGETDGDQQSGCIIVLYALATINNACIRANPWLG